MILQDHDHPIFLDEIPLKSRIEFHALLLGLELVYQYESKVRGK
jgi:hypothetical protein